MAGAPFIWVDSLTEPNETFWDNQVKPLPDMTVVRVNTRTGLWYADHAYANHGYVCKMPKGKCVYKIRKIKCGNRKLPPFSGDIFNWIFSRGKCLYFASLEFIHKDLINAIGSDNSFAPMIPVRWRIYVSQSFNILENIHLGLPRLPAVLGVFIIHPYPFLD